MLSHGNFKMDWDFISNRISFFVGNWKKVKFRNDRWCLMSPYASLFQLCLIQPHQKSKKVHWFSTKIDYWEMDDIKHLFSRL